MLIATLKDRPIVVDILTSSFEANKSVNYVIKQDSRKRTRMKLLMEYSFYTCFQFGEIFLSEDKKGCALMLYPGRRRTTLKTLIWELKLALFAIGPKNIIKTIRRESEIKKRQPSEPFTYLWFIGVTPEAQGTGIGSSLLQQVLQHSSAQKKGIYLETSTLVNLPWYQKFGFEIYDELDLGYRLFFLKRA